MILAVLIATSAPQSALEADRSLAAAVQTEGQWTALRRFAAPDAIWFQNGPHQASRALARAPNPPSGITWTVAESISSCDGTTAFTIGPMRRPSGEIGSLLIVWRKQPDGRWKWIAVRAAATVGRPGPEPRVTTASCEGRPHSYISPAPEGPSGEVWSPDRTFWWSYRTDRWGRVAYSIRIWNGTEHWVALSGRDTGPARQ